MEMLYNLEYEVAKLRKQYIDLVEYDSLTLKEVLDLGFNNVYIDDIGIYKDNKGNYVAKRNFITDEDLLSAKIKYDYNDTYYDEYGEYLEVYCSFIETKYNDLLRSIANGNDEEEEV